MMFARDHLEALAAVVDAGTFDAAARELRVTPSAVSQRIRALEERLGHVVVRRTTPCRPTAAGAAVLRLARQVRVVEAEARAAIDATAPTGLVRVAVNADSLATWFAPVIAAVARRPHLSLHLEVEDQAHSRELLRGADVMAAVTSDAEPVQGCRAQRLGTMTYRAVAHGALVERHAAGGRVDWDALPVVHFNAKDALQRRVLRDAGSPGGPAHQVPTSEGFRDAVRAGLGWGLIPDAQRAPGDGLVALPGVEPVTVPLHWQRWRIESALLDEMTGLVRDAAGRLAPG